MCSFSSVLLSVHIHRQQRALNITHCPFNHRDVSRMLYCAVKTGVLKSDVIYDDVCDWMN